MNILDSTYKKVCQLIGKKFPKIYCRCAKHSSFAKFFVAGGIASATDLLFLFLFHGLFNLGIVLSTSVAFLLSFLVSFYLQRAWAFNRKEEKKIPRELALYMLNAFLSLNINGLGMHFLVNQVGIWYLLSQIIVNIMLGLLNFFIYKFIIFRHDDETNCEQEPLEEF
jgi:putative flippase GtrA